MSSKQERSSSKHKNRCLPTSKELNEMKDVVYEEFQGMGSVLKKEGKEMLRLKGGADDGENGMWKGVALLVIGCVLTLWVLIFLGAILYSLSAA